MVESSPGTWRDFVWVCAAIAGFDFVAIFLFYPESSFVRPPLPDSGSNRDENNTPKEELDSASNVAPHSEHLESEQGRIDVVAISLPKVWTSFIHYNPNISLPRAFALPFVFLGCLPVLWTILVYGSALASQVILMYVSSTLPSPKVDRPF